MKKKLEFQADRIEAVLEAHGTPGHVTGGTVTPRWVRFQVHPTIGTKVSAIRALSDEVAIALGVPDVKIDRRGAVVAIEVPSDEPVTVDTVLDGMAYCKQAHTAALGIAEDGAPLMVNLCSNDGAHVLITGEGRAGVLALMTESLIRWNEPEAMRVADANGQLEVLAQGVTNGRVKREPLAVALVGGDVAGSPASLRTVLELGPGVGLHVIMTTSHITDDLKALFPTHITGLGDGQFHCVAPDFQGMFQAPVLPVSQLTEMTR